MDEARNEINIDTVKGFVQGDNNIVTNEFFDKARQIDWNARFTLATDLRLESFKLGDTAAAKFPYVVAPVIDIYNDAIQALHTCSTEKDSAKRGILLFGEANAGKTRLALETLRQALPTWPVFRWRPDYIRDDLPSIEYLIGKRFIFFIDDLQDYVSIQVPADPRAIALRTIIETLTQNTEFIIIIATCRIEDKPKVQTVLSWLFIQLTNIILPSFSADIQDPEAAQVIAEFQKQSTIHVEDWDGTLGSLVLGLSTKNSQYLYLFENQPLAALVLHSMKLLMLANTTLHRESLLRTICEEIFDEKDIQDRLWREAIKQLVFVQFVTMDNNSIDRVLTIRKDTYFDKVITEYPQPFQPHQIQQDFVSLKKIFINRKDEEALLDLGFAFSDLQLTEEALDCFNEVLIINPFYIAAWYLKGLALSILDRNNEALAAFDQALTFDSDNADVWYQKGLTLNSMGQNEEALAAFDHTLLLDPSNTNAWYYKSHFLSSQKRNEEALAAFDRALALDPSDSDTWYMKGRSLYRLGRKEEALEAFDRAVALNPKNTDSLIWKGFTLNVLERNEEALAAINRALTLNPKDSYTWYQKGLALYSLDRDEEALAALEHALTLKSDNADFWYLKALAFYSLDQDGNVLIALDHALALSPVNAVVNYIKIHSPTVLIRYEKALTASDRALTLNPNDTDVWYRRGLTLSILGRHEEALVALDQALALNPNNAASWHLKSLSLYVLNRDKEAISAFDRTLTLDPTNAKLWYLKGITFNMLNQYEEALIAFDRALSLNPNDAAVWYWKGLSFIDLDEKQDKKKESIENNHSLTHDPNTDLVLLRKADVFQALGKEKEARRRQSQTRRLSKLNIKAWFKST